MRAAVIVVCACVILSAERASAQVPGTVRAQGSFQPPVVDASTDATYVSGQSVFGAGGAVAAYGGAVTFGRALERGENPRLGFEAGVLAVHGGATFEASPGFEFGVGFRSVVGSVTLKARPFRPARTGVVGLTAYLGSLAGFSVTSTTNEIGTANRNGFILGASGGASLDFALGGRVGGLLFAGGRLTSIGPFAELTDRDTPERLVAKTPEFGGSLAVHVSADLDVTLGTLLNWLERGDEEDLRVKTLVLGLMWRSQDTPRDVEDRR